MIPLNLMLAVCLITIPIDGNDRGSDDSGIPKEVEQELYLRETIRQVALNWELLDIREGRNTFNQPEGFAADIMLVRRRYQSLCDAPPLLDSIRFPDKEFIANMIDFNRAYNRHLQEKKNLDPRQITWLYEAEQENDWLYHVWDLVRDARCEYYYVNVRRDALQKLRNEIGLQAYYAGCLPPIVPVWRFNRID